MMQGMRANAFHIPVSALPGCGNHGVWCLSHPPVKPALFRPRTIWGSSSYVFHTQAAAGVLESRDDGT